jgi:hypothetical protein
MPYTWGRLVELYHSGNVAGKYQLTLDSVRRLPGGDRSGHYSA